MTDSPQVIGEARIIACRDDLVEALRSRKAELNLSNEFVENATHMTDGGCDKVLGPSQQKGMSWDVAFNLVELFGCRLVIEPSPDNEAKWRPTWERRESLKVHPQKCRFPRGVVRKMGRLGGQNRIASLTPASHIEMSRKGGKARLRKMTKAQRSESARRAAFARWRKANLASFA